MPAFEVLPALSREDPLFGLIYYVLGGWLIGSGTVLLLEGILIAQVTNYYSWYSEDSVGLKPAVGGLFILTILKAIQSFGITWINNILYMQDPAGTVALNKEWYQILNIPLAGLQLASLAIISMRGLVHRVRYKLVGKWWLIAPLVTVMLLGLVSAIITASVIAKSGKSSDWFAVHVSCTFATDVFITGASTYFLVSARQKALSRTRKLISAVMKISIQAALPVTTATLIELICSRIGGESLKLQAINSTILVLLDAIPIIYANCMLYILNTRRALRNANPSTGLSNSNNVHTLSGGRSRIQCNHTGMELSTLGGVQVHKNIEAGDNSGFDSKQP